MFVGPSVCAISLQWYSPHNYYPSGIHIRIIIQVRFIAELLSKWADDDAEKPNNHKGKHINNHKYKYKKHHKENCLKTLWY